MENEVLKNRVKSYKNIIGDAKATIEAIQNYLQQFSVNHNNVVNEEEVGSTPCASVNKILASTQDKELQADVAKIIDSL